jgi:hypothetical protein
MIFPGLYLYSLEPKVDLTIYEYDWQTIHVCLVPPLTEYAD